MEKKWNILGESLNPESTLKIEKLIQVDRIIASLLQLRGFTEFEEIRDFFRPDYSHLHDPFLMEGMQIAIERISNAVSSNEKILIYGDYDVDGTTAVSLVYSFFKTHTPQIEFYIPDRYAEGYGISYKGIDYAAENNFSLVIALDCGIKATDKIKYANEKNVDFIICDHHLPGDQLPDALAVLDPKKKTCGYPYKELSGAGIGFKLIQAYSIKHQLPIENCYQYLDLVVTSIAADIVPITGENRVLAYYGLEKINTNPCPGIKAIMNVNQMKKEVNINNLVFVLGPRINAAGRIKHGSAAVELLTCEDDQLSEELAKDINDTNSQRKDLDLGTTNEAIEMMETDPMTSFRKSTVLFNPGWHKGVVGIVASRLIERYYKPTIVLTQSDSQVTGSARSVKDYDVYQAIEQCHDLLDQFGGHKYAAGLTMKPENVEAFKIKFEEIVSSSITASQLVPQIDVDLIIELHEINPKLVRILNQFAPHGPQNLTPLFCSKEVYDTGWAKIVGNNHLRLEVYQKSNPNLRFSAIGFDKGDFINFLKDGKPVDIVYKIQENEYNGNIFIQLIIEDIKLT
ncbi:MAG: single-stranded-DNA-specific exonuclease RecJ [Bacteroidia bacterium]